MKHYISQKPEFEKEGAYVNICSSVVGNVAK
jgi:hypothetical protein